jgi:hypothetical protein
LTTVANVINTLGYHEESIKIKTKTVQLTQGQPVVVIKERNNRYLVIEMRGERERERLIDR